MKRFRGWKLQQPSPLRRRIVLIRTLIFTLLFSSLWAASLCAEPVFLRVVSGASIVDQPRMDNAETLGRAEPGWLLQAVKLKSAPDGSEWYEILKIDHDGGGFWFAYNMYGLNGKAAWVNKTAVEIAPAPNAADEEARPAEGGQTERDVYPELAQNDLAAVFGHHSPGRIGIIGHDGRRFYIHFASVLKNDDKPYEYLVKGWTRVDGNICSFEGSITIKEAKLLSETVSPRFKQGWLVAEATLVEEKSQKGAGSFKGRLKSFFVIDPFGRIRYDDLMIGADLYANNLFVGTWISYKSGATKICNFGDWRIPHEGLPEGFSLDKGAGQFLPDEVIVDKGWQSYAACHGVFKAPDDMSAAEREAWGKACQEEERQWWR